MNMIPQVRATEQGRAQNVNLYSQRIVWLSCITSVGVDASLFGTKRQRG